MIKRVNVLGGSQDDYINMAVLEAEDKAGWKLVTVTGSIDLSIRLGVPLWAIFYKDEAVFAGVDLATDNVVVVEKVTPKSKTKPKRVKSKIGTVLPNASV